MADTTRWGIENMPGRYLPNLVTIEPGFGEVMAVCMSRRSGRIVHADSAQAALVRNVRDHTAARDLATSLGRSINPGNPEWMSSYRRLIDLLTWRP